MPKPLLRMFSKRRVQIEEAMDRLGLDGPKGAQYATLDTRTPKGGNKDSLSLRERWQHEAHDAGHNLEEATIGVLHCCDAQRLGAAARDLALAQGPGVDAVSDELLDSTGLTAKRSTFDR